MRRWLEVSGYHVVHVKNITDVGHLVHDDSADAVGEDKIEKKTFNFSDMNVSENWIIFLIDTNGIQFDNKYNHYTLLSNDKTVIFESIFG